jgi:hypothetical protein
MYIHAWGLGFRVRKPYMAACTPYLIVQALTQAESPTTQDFSALCADISAGMMCCCVHHPLTVLSAVWAPTCCACAIAVAG